MHYTFPSLLEPNKIAYTAHTRTDDSLWEQARRGGHALGHWCGWFETYGDGMVQHAPECVARKDRFADYCASLAAFLLENPEAAKELESRWPRGGDRDMITFAHDIRHKPGKSQWYSLGDRRVSAAESRKYDTRWKKVEEWHDGSLAAIYDIIGGKAMGEVIDKFALAVAIRDELYFLSGASAGVGACILDMLGLQGQKDVWQAWGACDQAMRAARCIDGAARVLDCWKHNARVEEAATATA